MDILGNICTECCLYEEGEVMDDAEHTIFECARWQKYRSALTSIIEMIMAANIIRVMIMSRENWTLMANYVERILRLKKKDLEVTPCRRVGIGTWTKGIVETLRYLLNFRHEIRTRIGA